MLDEESRYSQNIPVDVVPPLKRERDLECRHSARWMHSSVRPTSDRNRERWKSSGLHSAPDVANVIHSGGLRLRRIRPTRYAPRYDTGEIVRIKVAELI
jgi:hypothetical protein